MELGSIILFIVFLVTVLGTLAELLFSKSKKGDSVEIPNQPAPTKKKTTRPGRQSTGSKKLNAPEVPPQNTDRQTLLAKDSPQVGNRFGWRNLRKGIVLMTVLGRCRALKPFSTEDPIIDVARHCSNMRSKKQ
jgi:hypothetical protein